MRRIACEADATKHQLADQLISSYNEGLGSGTLAEQGLDTPYEPGSVAKLGYGVDKYVLLRVGPFPDLYESLSLQHLAKGDESSALIAAEASNGKFSGFGSTFAFYARLLSKLPNRVDEARDAARVCLRLPLSTAGMTVDDFRELAVLAGLAEADDSTTVAIEKLQRMYEKIRHHEEEANGPGSDSGKTPEQMAIDEAASLLDKAAMHGGHWGTIRKDLAGIYAKAGNDAMAKFVDPSLI